MIDLLKPDIAVLIEGRWATCAGLTAGEAEEIVRTARKQVAVRHLPDDVYWGKAIEDERYLLISRN